MSTLRPLRSTLIGLGLFAGMASAQAALTLTFEQHDATGHLKIIFGGQQIVPFVAESPFDSMPQFNGTSVYVTDTSSWSVSPTGWMRTEALPWTNGYANAVSFSGAGGFSSFFPVHFQAISAVEGNEIIWDGHIIYVGNLAGIGLSDGQNGTITFAQGIDTISIDWSAVVIPVPEPATYALALGIGVAGVALLRRRSRR